MLVPGFRPRFNHGNVELMEKPKTYTVVFKCLTCGKIVSNNTTQGREVHLIGSSYPHQDRHSRKDCKKPYMLLHKILREI